MLEAVWIALSVLSTATVGPLGLAVSVQPTVAAWALVADATGRTSEIVPANCELRHEVDGQALGDGVSSGPPAPPVVLELGTDSVQSTSTCCPVAPLITACG